MIPKKGFYFIVFLVLSVPLSIGIWLKLESDTLKLILAMSSIFIIVLHLPIINDFRAWGVAVNLKREIKKAEVTFSYLTEVLVPLVEALYKSTTNAGRYVNTITDDSDLPIAILAKHLNIYDTPKIIKERIRMYNLGKYDAINRLRVITKQPTTTIEEEEKNNCDRMIDKFKSEYDISAFSFPTVKELDEFYEKIKNNNFIDNEDFQHCRTVFIKQDQLLANTKRT